MPIRIETVKVDVENKGKYRVATVTYKSPQGKIEAKKIMSFASKPVFEAVSAAQPGDVFDVVSEKDDKGFWQWTSVAAAGKVVEGSAPRATASPRSTYETPEERAIRQVYIVRQSSISNAVDFFALGKKAPTVEELLAVAREFEAYVFSVGEIVEDDPIEIS